ncbi:conserved hypothetical protein, partial [Escherichia coli TA206]
MTDAKSPAADAVNALPEGEAKTELQGRLDKVTGIQVPDVNDANSNGKPDTVDAQEKAALDHAKALVAEAEAKQGEAKDALTKAQADNAINPQEHNDLTAKNQAVTDAKSPAADAVNALPEGEAKTELQGRLDKVTGIQVPDV